MNESAFLSALHESPDDEVFWLLWSAAMLRRFGWFLIRASRLSANETAKAAKHRRTP